MTQNLNNIIDSWIKALEPYDLLQLSAQPSPGCWSLGQMYLHLINDTNYYLGQIKICVSTNDFINEEASPAAKTMFLKNEFPEIIIEGSPENSSIPQPQNKEQLLSSLMNLKTEMNDIEKLIVESPFQGKTKHPGLHYFSAKEWLQFADMHFRHHLRQKKRIDTFLKIKEIG